MAYSELLIRLPKSVPIQLAVLLTGYRGRAFREIPSGSRGPHARTADVLETSEGGRNAQTHSPEPVAQIGASIVEFGFINPILVDTNAGHDLQPFRNSRHLVPTLIQDFHCRFSRTVQCTPNGLFVSDTLVQLTQIPRFQPLALLSILTVASQVSTGTQRCPGR
jgi:hypothetical protein